MLANDGELTVAGGMILVGVAYVLSAAILWLYRRYEQRKERERLEQQQAREARLRHFPIDGE